MTQTQTAKPILQVRDLKRYFDVSDGLLSGKSGKLRAVDGITFDIRAGETLGLVGESGCGKSTLGRVLARLMPATSGEVLFKDTDILHLDRRRLLALRADIQSVFQDPSASLNPRMTAFSLIEEPLVIQKVGNSRTRRAKVMDLLQTVGLRAEFADRYPHEFSGGQRQRIGIARALALDPKLLILDEPVSALDVSIQAQIINLLAELQDRLDLTYLFISHDLSVIQHAADRIAVMYMGQIVELAENEEFYANPQHPYSMALLSALPLPDPHAARNRILLQGDLPDPANLPEGCRFQSRCAHVTDKCRMAPEPQLEETSSGHFVRCWNLEKIHGPKRPQ
ncbi:ATP-binding cassette domain-containing protein [Aliishimia ponticola]|uniref:ATP-binding cassette domain-containing protein n=1 Tax=Aliishimia ponticola TaxID=2499833 RepID=A0A4S4N6U3_9RHOB|nr:oligopeptide/dipeptide ABC transporter ATP-binding protein [Aliishimia ponticola]THH34779.1 ATP-binding cassette domain-containing protein [Aliishimia ponticola]